MQSLDELSGAQGQIGEEIKRLFKNYTKDSAERKTLTYLELKRSALQQQWDLFEVNDTNIRIHHGTQLQHAYFVKTYYDAVKQGYDQMMQDIEARITISSIKSPTGDDGEELLSTASSEHTDEALDSRSTAGPTLKKQQAILLQLVKMLSTLPPLDQPHLPQFWRLKIETFERYLQTAQQLHEKLWHELDETNYNSEEFFTVEEQVQSKIIELHEGFNSNVRKSSPQVEHKEEHALSNISPLMKLPKIVLPTFDGNYLQWRQFHELVDKQRIANCQKMWYLKTSLTGEAEKLIRHLTTSDANYSAAWKLIKDRFENTRLLTTAFLDKLLSQPSTTAESAVSIKNLHDTTQECLLGLQNLGVDIENWDPIIIHVMLKKLDRVTHTLYEQSIDQPRKLQPMKQFLTFLEMRFQSLEALGHKNRPIDQQRKSSYQHRTSTSSIIAETNCSLCKGSHKLFSCAKFLALAITKRFEHAKKAKLCINCLGSGHNTSQCLSRACTKCAKKHNTLLHMGEQQTAVEVNSSNDKQHSQSSSSHGTSAITLQDPAASLSARTWMKQKSYTLLSTVLINISDRAGNQVQCRAILDSGSQLNLITDRLVKKLQLVEYSDHISIEGIGEKRQLSRKRVNISLQSRINGFTTRLEAYTLQDIISPQPTQLIDISSWQLPNNIVLADPKFNQPAKIDLLIGAELYFSLLAVGQIRLGNDLPILQNTTFGWIVAGRSNQTSESIASCGVGVRNKALEEQIEKFWHIEEKTSSGNNMTTMERQCENFFTQTTTKAKDGHYIVRLPFGIEPSKLGESKDIAYQRFLSLERKLGKNPELRVQYKQFMDEFIRLGHMKEIPAHEIEKPYYFLPHHCVLKPESSTTKLRVVFDASAKTSTNISLNDVLNTGPTIQDDVFSILLRFRMPRFVFTADIEKMYRQVWVDESDRKYQLLWWRDNPEEQMKCFQLCTVTYGTTSAPYLATKCLQYLADNQTDVNSPVSKVLKHDFYVDDVLTGTNSLPAALELQQQLRDTLKTAGFKLRKWCANHPRLLQTIPPEDREIELHFENKNEEHVKTIGLTWLPKSDEFSVRTSWNEQHKVTKRTVCSDIAHLFDPLGIMAPVIVVAKIFLQELWKLKLEWDAALPQDKYTTWVNFRGGLKSLNDIKIQRHIYAHRSPKTMQVHIFADASEKAYGAVAYIRSVDKDNLIIVRLLCAKSRVAPTNKTTLPRLELCAAKVAAELAQRIRIDLNLSKEMIYLWTDSEIVLAWINSTTSSFHTFVANRISQIQEITIPSQWRHVRSEDNPADILSRGIVPEKLAQCSIWFYGPRFLNGSESIWPAPYLNSRTDYKEERKRTAATALLSKPQCHFIDNINHKNSFRKLQRIVAFMLRFVHKCRNPSQQINKSITPNVHELEESRIVIIKTIQNEKFASELHQLQHFGEINKNSALITLSPFLDEQNVLRVGGRLEASNLTQEAKHPAILPYDHQVTKLIMTGIHKDNHHVPPQALLYITRERYWPVKGKTLARSIIQHCIKCVKTNPQLLTQKMGNLPAHRVQPSRPFINTGVDFCGPIMTHYKLRGKRPQKSYIAVFCCFATKAVHLEVVTDLTTQGFLGALKRFMGRRGHCRNIYCDNATNFVGAKAQLEELKLIFETEQCREHIISTCSANSIDFHFIPPRAPHFGGLWEAAVKAAKHRLRHTLASASLTYEELETVAIEVEALLNSRPLTPMSSDPNDLMALTPGHFLIGEPLTNSIDPHATSRNSGLISRWKQVTKIKSEFWQRWSVEYLNQLQQRHKWKTECQNIVLGTMVIIKDDNRPPMQWPLGRIIKIIKGEDGLVRVADVRTANGVFRRPIHRLAPLPMAEESADSNIENYPENEQHNDTEMTEDPSSKPTQTCEPPRKIQRRSLGSAMVTLLLTCLFPIMAHTATVQITPFDSQPGLYFENLGPTNLISGKWDIIAFYDMQPFWKEFDALKGYGQLLGTACQAMIQRESCQKIVYNFRHLTEELQSNNKLLVPIATAANSRSKRGAINLVGNLANALFGVLDSNYAESMSKTIETIERNEEHLDNLITNQTSLLDATINVIKRSEEAIDKQLKEVDSFMLKIITDVNNTEEQLFQEQLTNTFALSTTQALMSVSNFQRIQTAILDVLVNTHHGKISPQLITPDQLKDELSKIKNNLPASLKLPARQDNILEYYSLMTIEGRPTQRHILFKLTLPLLMIDDFELFNVVPVPVLVNHTFMALRPSAAYLIVNLHRDEYCPLDNLQSCTKTIGQRYLCDQQQPLYKKGSIMSACEIDLLNRLPHSSVCHIMEVGKGPHWTKLHNINQWMYALEHPTTLNVVCKENITQITIQDSGVIKLLGECIIKQQLLTIRSHTVSLTETALSYLPFSNLTEAIEVHRPSLLPSIPHDYHLNLTELDSIRKELKQIRLDVPIKSHVHFFNLGYLSLLLIVVFITWFAWKYHSKCRKTVQVNELTLTPRITTTEKNHSNSEANDFDINFSD